MLNNRKRRPTHPGVVLREDIMPAAKLTQVDLARLLKVSRRTVNEICTERRPVSTDLALRLARVFNTSPDLWLNLQKAVDVWETWEENQELYEEIKPITARVA